MADYCAHSLADSEQRTVGGESDFIVADNHQRTAVAYLKVTAVGNKKY